MERTFRVTVIARADGSQDLILSANEAFSPQEVARILLGAGTTLLAVEFANAEPGTTEQKMRITVEEGKGALIRIFEALASFVSAIATQPEGEPSAASQPNESGDQLAENQTS